MHGYVGLSVELLVIVLIAASATVLHRVIQIRFPHDRLRTQNDVAGFLFSAVGVIYAVVLGFVVIIVWGKYDAAVANSNSEIAAVADLYRSIAPFPVAQRDNIRMHVHEYIDEIINDDYPLMAAGGHPANVSRTLEGIAGDVEMFSPTTRRDQNAQAAALIYLQRIFDTRRLRLEENRHNVPGILWFALIAGAAAILGFAYLFGVENSRSQLVMTAVLATLIAILFVVVYDFDVPFSHGIGISSDPWTALHARLYYIR
ncbi:MAG TPA: DUF4239 domain-containing protein [Candidatus Baltobacteraceae bacterium]